MAYPAAIQMRNLEESMTIIDKFDEITADGVITPEEHMEFDALAISHYYTAETIELSQREMIYKARTGKSESVWHNRQQKALEKSQARNAVTFQAQ